MKIIYCVEDDYSTRELLICALETVNYKVLGFSNNQRFMEKLNNSIPDMILLDIMFQGEDSTNILKNLKEDVRFKNIPVIILSALSTEKVIVKCFDLGADDFIKKPFGMLELISRVKAILRRTSIAGTENGRVAVNEVVLDYKNRKAKYKNSNVDLNYKEFELLYYLITNKGLVLSRDEIIHNIWDPKYKEKKRTVNAYVSSIRRKFKALGCTDIIKTVRSAGFKIEDNP